jgi:hypothetical protein
MIEKVEESIPKNGIDSKMMQLAMKGMYKLHSQGRVRNDSLLVMIDYTKNSAKDRFYVLDVKNQRIVYKNLVAHGKNTGSDVATTFSNISGSKRSCYGFFTTGELYSGKFDLALKLDGLEYSNYNARPRGIVIHKAKYVSQKYVESNGRLGRSLGCPALPEKGFEEIARLLESGVCVFAYYPNDYYLKRSKIIND